MRRRLSQEEYQELYNEMPDEFMDAPFADCPECGKYVSTDNMPNGFCEDCNAIHADQENLEFAREQFNETVYSVFNLTNQDKRRKGLCTLLGAMASVLKREADEKTLWRIINVYNETMKGK